MNEVILTFKDWAGINNRSDSIRLNRIRSQVRNKTLVIGTNCDIDNDRMLTRRIGRTQVISNTGFHSMWSNGSICLLVQNNILKRMYEDYSLENLTTGLSPSGQRMSYADMKDGRMALTDGYIIGYVRGGAYTAMPTPSTTPKFRTKIPAGQLVAWYHGRLYIANGDRLYYSDPFALRMRAKKNFIQLTGYITMLEAVDNGLWVSDGKIHFLSGESPTKFIFNTKADYNAIIHTAAKVHRELTGLKDISGPTIWVATEKGICIAGNSGGFINLTIKKYTMPAAKQGAALYKDTGNKSQYISVLES